VAHFEAISLPKRLAKALPDAPGWIDTRGMLLSDGAVVSGGDSIETGFVVRASSGALSAIAVVGRPAHDAIVRAVDGVTDMTPVLSQPDNAAHVATALASCPPSRAGITWRPERVVLHDLRALSEDEPREDVTIRLLGPDDPIDHLPAGLRFEIFHARSTVPVAVTVVDGRAVSFCYACWTTETLWDVSIDTLEAYRRRGLGARAVRFMIARMNEENRQPVWGASESNAASRALARTLGFRPAAEIVAFSRGPWAYLTQGFDDA
jgi:RimJ/RimL family protein N-acetyltransferase